MQQNQLLPSLQEESHEENRLLPPWRKASFLYSYIKHLVLDPKFC